MPPRDIAGLWNGCATKGAASGDAAARIFLPQLVDFDLNSLSQFISEFFKFPFKKKLVFFALTYIICLREIRLDRGVVVQKSLPLPMRLRGGLPHRHIATPSSGRRDKTLIPASRHRFYLHFLRTTNFRHLGTIRELISTNHGKQVHIPSDRS
jgi:hypothetical protein